MRAANSGIIKATWYNVERHGTENKPSINITDATPQRIFTMYIAQQQVYKSNSLLIIKKKQNRNHYRFIKYEIN